MQKPDLLRPTLISGLVFGAASALPVTSCCCCLWIIATGWLATVLYAKSAKRTGYPVRASDGALLGLVAGLFGGFVCSILETLISLVFGEKMRELMLTMLDRMDLPSNMTPLVEGLRHSLEQEVTVGAVIFSLMMSLFFFALFGTIGGLLTAVFIGGGRGGVAPPPIGGTWQPPRPTQGWGGPSGPPPAPSGGSDLPPQPSGGEWQPSGTPPGGDPQASPRPPEATHGSLPGWEPSPGGGAGERKDEKDPDRS